MLGNCSGYCGANSETTVPSGWTSARYSPPALRLNLVCNGAPATRRSLPEAKTTRKPPGGMLVDGKDHLARSRGESVRNQPPRFTVFVPELKSSIQSEDAPSSSSSPLVLLAANSEMMTVPAAAAFAAAASK